MLRLSFVLTVTVLFGCLPSHPAILSTDGAPAFRPDTFFLGATQGRGTLSIAGRGADSVRVESQGRPLTDGSFELIQTITIGDAEPRDRTWIMVPDGPDTWTGTLDDASGAVRVRADGAMLHIRYRINPVTTFHQRLVLLADGRTVENRSSARILGVPVARLAETITRETSVFR